MDVLFLSELKLQEGDKSFSRQLPGYDVHERLRVGTAQGGILVMLKDKSKLLYDVWDGDLHEGEDWVTPE
jgi:hypothetical protein